MVTGQVTRWEARIGRPSQPRPSPLLSHQERKEDGDKPMIIPVYYLVHGIPKYIMVWKIVWKEWETIYDMDRLNSR